jgi:alpha-L-rhamnosidase
MTEAFNKQFLTIKRGTSLRPGHVLYPDSIYYGNNTVTANLLPLALGIVPDDCKEDVLKQIVENICVQNKGHVSCGVIGISWLLRGLSDNGFADVAYLLATQKKYPSWGYMAENGATTIWELWNGDRANPKMNSGNHVMLLGDLLTWCYQYVGGIRSTDAYKHIVLKPAFDIQDSEWANVSFDSPYGSIISNWKKNQQHLSWHVAIPCNTTATVYLPDGTTKEIGSGAYNFSCDIPTSHPAILKDEFLYERTFFPEAHASTIVETKKGDLVAAYFGGTHEKDPDVCIYVNIKKKGSNEWTAPILAADGVLDLSDSRIKYAGLSGMNEETTSAEAGPVKTLSEKKGFITYDYTTKKSHISLPTTLKRKSCWNPVLFEMPNGELWLFFKIGSSVGDWTGWLAKSKDGGKTWSDKEPLGYDAEGRAYLGPIKNKPELINNRLLCPSSTEKNGWRFHMEILDLSDGLWKNGKAVKDLNWKWIPVESTEATKTDDMKKHPIDCIQPSILKLKDGRLQVLMRTHNARLATSFSSDNGDTWTPVTLSEVVNNQSGTDAVTLSDGRHALIYNNFETLPMTPKGVRTPCSIALSDDGEHWYHALTLEDSPIDQYSYPAIIQGRDGKLHCVYTWRRQRVSYKEIDLSKLK